MKHTNGTETLKTSMSSVAEKSAEMAKTFVESSAKQFEASLNAGKAIFDTITRQFPKTTDKQAEEVKSRFEDTYNTTTKWVEESSKIPDQLI